MPPRQPTKEDPMGEQTVLVTGGTGYVASWCIAELLRQGYRVRTTVRSPKSEPAVRDAVSSVDDRLTFHIADLTSDEGWDTAVAGADFVLHVASPLGDAGDLIGPARDGALRVLRAATSAGVQRVVMTSAANAASPSSYGEDSVTDETLWTDLSDPTLIPYRRAKTLAEEAAWDFMDDYDGPTTLTTILPGAVFGPILDAGHLGTTEIIARMLNGGMRGAPRIAFEIVDVRDIADIHLRAMTSPSAAGERFLATGELMWMREMALALRSGLGPAADRAPTREVPDFAVRLAARFLDPSLRSIVPALGRRNRHSTSKAREILGWQARPAAETVVACARSLIDAGVHLKR
jgi:dihydroflavonol-4-reductase